MLKTIAHTYYFVNTKLYFVFFYIFSVKITYFSSSQLTYLFFCDNVYITTITKNER